MEKSGTEQATRKNRALGLFLSPTQLGLALGVALVGCLTAFGGGVIVGMWYKASEQITPYQTLLPAADPQEQGAAGVEQDTVVTFYSTLMRDDVAHEPLAAMPSALTTKEQLAALLPRPAPATLQAPVEASPLAALDAPVVASAATEIPPGPFRVQLGSFRTRQRAERLRRELAAKGHKIYVELYQRPGKEDWYRVRMGGFADRKAAQQMVQRLKDEERIAAIVAAP